MITLENILKKLFEYSTENKEDEYNPKILDCLNEISFILRKEKIENSIQYFTLKNRSKKGANLFAYNSKSKGPVILFQGHLDTVLDENYRNIKITKSYIKGRGAVDMKGSLGAMITAFAFLYNKKLSYSPALLITTDEEGGDFYGINNFFNKNKDFLRKIAFVINGEPTNLNVVNKFRGVLSYNIEKKGKRSHSAYPQKHLLEEMVPTIEAIKLFLDNSRKIKSSTLGRTIGAFTVINSGDKSNILPGEFKASFNLRTVREFKNYNTLFKKIFNNVLDKKTKVSKFYYNPTEVQLKTKFNRAIKIALKNNRVEYKKDIAVFFTEANIFNKKGIPALSIGPGNPKLAHVDSKKEIIYRRDLKKYCDFLINLFDELNKP